MVQVLPYFAIGIVVATVLTLVAWLRFARPRSPLRSVDQFNDALRALAPRQGRPKA